MERNYTSFTASWIGPNTNGGPKKREKKMKNNALPSQIASLPGIFCPAMKPWYHRAGGIMTRIMEFAGQIKDNVERVIIGKGQAIELLIVALLCDGHILIEDVP